LKIPLQIFILMVRGILHRSLASHPQHIRTLPRKTSPLWATAKRYGRFPKDSNWLTDHRRSTQACPQAITKTYQSLPLKFVKTSSPCKRGFWMTSPVSSSTSRLIHISGVSPASNLPPNPFHFPSWMSLGFLFR
jgi:hypothetical protein